MKFSNDTLRNSLNLEEALKARKSAWPQKETEHLADGLRKFRKKMIKTTGDRILENVIQNEENGCWDWIAAKDKNGYAKISIRDKCFIASRVSYFIFISDFGDGLTIDHLCKNTGCVNPGHLEPVSLRENLQRGNTFQSKNKAKTQCLNGHEFNFENTSIQKDRIGVKRACKICAKNRKLKHRNKSTS